MLGGGQGQRNGFEVAGDSSSGARRHLGHACSRDKSKESERLGDKREVMHGRVAHWCRGVLQGHAGMCKHATSGEAGSWAWWPVGEHGLQWRVGGEK